MDAFFQSVVFPGTVVLAGKGGKSLRHSGKCHPEQDIHFPVGGPGGHGIGAKEVDGSLNNNVGKAVHHRLESGGNADEHNGLKGLGMEAQFPGNQAEGFTLDGH